MPPTSALSVRAEAGTRVAPPPVMSAPDLVRPPSPESGVDSSREDSPSRESILVRPLGTSGLAELDVDEPAEEPLSAGAGSLGGGTESVLPLTVSEPLGRPARWLLLADACAVESPDAAAGTAPEVALEVSAALVHPAASGAVPGATVVAAAAVPVEVPEGSETLVHPAASGAVPGATVVAAAAVPVEVPEGSEALVHPAASGAVPGATVVAVASVPEGSEALVHPAASGAVSGATVVAVASVPEGSGTSVLGSVAPIAVSGEVSAESAVSDASAFAEVSVSGAGTAAPVVLPEASAASAVGAFVSVAVPEVLPASVAVPDVPGTAGVTGGAAAGGESMEAGGAGSSARAVWTKNDAQPRAASSAAVQPRTRGHRRSANSNPVRLHSAPLAMAAVVLRASEYRS
jgi:hypothetical protein